MQQRVTDIEDRLPRQGNAFTRWLGHFLLWLIGWRITGSLPNVPKAVVIGAPHTSNYDGLLALASILALGVRINVLAKHTLFNGLGGVILRFLGCIPVNRQAAHGLIEESARKFDEHDELFLGMAPEGTRKAAERWKKGFYLIAHKAQVPIVVAVLDYGKKEVRLPLTLYPAGNYEADLQKILACYGGAKAAKNEWLSLPLRELNANEHR